MLRKVSERGRKKQAEIEYIHMYTNISIKSSTICSTCPYKIYASEEDKVTLGIGNINSNFIFILPTYDTKAKIGYPNLLGELVKAYFAITNKNLFEEIYVTRLVKCSKMTNHNMYSSCISACSNYLIYEVNKLQAKNIIFFGSTYDDYINSQDIVGMNIPFKTIHKLYSPAVLFYENAKIKDKFVEDLTTILNNY